MKLSRKNLPTAFVLLTALTLMFIGIYGQVYHTSTIDIFGNIIELRRIGSFAVGLQFLCMGLYSSPNNRNFKWLYLGSSIFFIFLGFQQTSNEKMLVEKAKFDKIIEEQRKHDEEIHATEATPLMLAAMNDNVDGIKSLLDKGADVNEKNKYGFVALDYAAGAIPPYFQDSVWHINAVNALLNHGAHPDDAGDDGISPLMSASIHGDKEMAEALIAHGADINYVSMHGWTALSEAVMFQREEMTSYLLEHKADPNIQLENGHHNLLKLAKRKSNQKIIDSLEKAGAKE